MLLNVDQSIVFDHKGATKQHLGASSLSAIMAALL